MSESIYPNPTNLTRFYEFTDYANTVTQDAFGWGILFAAFLIAFLTLKASFSTAKSLATAGYITTILSIFFFILGLVGFYVMLIMILLTVVGSIMLWWEGR